MNSIIDFFKRHSVWLIIGLLSIWVFSPALSEIKTILMIVTVECLAIALSGISAYVYTRTDFSQIPSSSNQGLIFLGVHICVGLVILGVYIVQFSS